MEIQTSAPDSRAATSDLLGFAALAVVVALMVSALLAAGVLLLASASHATAAAPDGRSVKSHFTLGPPAPG